MRKISSDELFSRLQARKRLHDAKSLARIKERRASLAGQQAEQRAKENGVYRDELYRNRPETVLIDGEPILADDRESEAFSAYVQLVEGVLKAADGEPLSVREIKLRLGDRLVERWLFDALATSTHVLHIQAYIDRFAYVEKLTIRAVHGYNDIQIAGTREPKTPDWF